MVSEPDTTLAIFRLHFARLWAARHDPAYHQEFIRASLRDNIKGQRGCVAYYESLAKVGVR